MSNVKPARDRTPGRRRTETISVPFGDLDELLGYKLRRAQRAVFQDFAASMERHDITPGHLGLLLQVLRNPDISQTALAGRLGIERATLGPIIDRFEQRGLIRRRQAENDRRSYALCVSAQGKRFLQTLWDDLEIHERRIAADLSAAERASLLSLLDRIALTDQPQGSD
ncbi:MAG: MarR family transcriptional regulator [Gammaproteobacteria bacterium]|nr:MarR family transcriptional regulator [Gammaproteobacteria bacterium]